MKCPDCRNELSVLLKDGEKIRYNCKNCDLVFDDFKMQTVFVVFMVHPLGETEFYNLQSTEEKAIEWIKKFGKGRNFTYEEYPVH